MAGALGAPNSFQFTAATGTAAVIKAANAGNVSPRCHVGVIIYAHAANTGTVFIGKDATITTSTGYALEAGKSVSIPCDDPSRVFAIGSAVSQVCSVLFT